MCRLVAWTGTAPRAAAQALGPANLDAFVQLGLAHRDGWGLAWWPQNEEEFQPPQANPASLPTGGLKWHHATTAAGEDPAFRQTMNDAVSDAGIVHLRWATPGLPVIAANCHPFVRGGLAMAHNGGIYPLERVSEILAPQWEARCEGTTDSERFVLSVVAGVGEGKGSVAEVLAEVVVRLFAGWQPSSLNAVCLTADEVIAVCAYDPSPRPSLPDPPDVYYRLSWRADAGGVVVASSGIDQPAEDGWTPLDNMSLLIAPRGGGAPEVRRLAVDVPDRHQPDPSEVR